MTTVSLDFETRSRVDLRKTGVYVYAEDPSTEIMCMAYAFDDEEPELWVPGGQALPARLVAHVQNGGALRAFNVGFERTMWRHVLPRHTGTAFIQPELEQWYCTAAEARAMALPRHLAGCARALSLPIKKDDEGRKLMLKMCKPKRDGSWHEDPEDLQRLYEYCLQDVRTERAVAKRLRRLGSREREVFLLDQRINDRGVLLDAPLIDAAAAMAKRVTAHGNARLAKLTDGEVTKVTQVARLNTWLETQGLDIPDLRKHTVRDLLAEGDVEGAVEKALQIRFDVGKTSAAKLQAMVRARCADGVARGTLLYHGAGTGRWAGQGIQPQNFPRGDVKFPERFILDILVGRDPDDWPDDVDALAAVTSLLRSCIIARPGHRFLWGDYGQIEARVLGWLAGEPFDDLAYEKMGAAIFRVPVEQVIEEHRAGNSEKRKMGKDTVLGCGYQMGWKRFQEQAWERSGEKVPDEMAQRAVDTYRSLLTGVPEFWTEALQAAWDATENPGRVFTCGGGRVRYVVKANFLWCILPSGRPLAYALPRIERRPTKFGPRDQLTFMGVHPYTRKWCRQSTYGGHLVENIVQAAARDIMAEGMLRLDRAGYNVVLSVHDEVVCDTPCGVGSLEEFRALLTERPDWAQDLYIKSDQWEELRYAKR